MLRIEATSHCVHARTVTVKHGFTILKRYECGGNIFKPSVAFYISDY